MEDQTEEFWRMVMECNCSIIVMLTNLEEKGKVKMQCSFNLLNMLIDLE